MNTAVVVIDPQNDVLSPDGKNWDSLGASVIENNTVQHLLDIFAAAKASDFGVFISPHTVNYTTAPRRRLALAGSGAV